MLKTEPVSFGEFMPDQISIKPGASQLIKNVLPHEDGYGPAKSPRLLGAGTPTTPYGALQYYVDGSSYLVVGTATGLHWAGGDALIAAGAGYTADDVNGWAFEVFGANTYAMTETDGLLSTASNTQGTFSAVAGAPNARYLQEYQDFLFAGQVSGFPARLQWSAFNNPTDWVVNPGLTQADFNDMDGELGEIRGLAGGQYIKVYQRRGITRGIFIGGDAIFRFDVMDRSKGLIAPKSLVSTGEFDFFLSEDGFNVFDGQRATNIGDDKVNEWFFERVPVEDREKVNGSIDVRRRIVTWAWPGSREYLRYSYRYNRWMLFELPQGVAGTDILPVQAAKSGYHMDIDAPGESTDLDGADGLPSSFDDAFWKSESDEPALFIGGSLYQMTGGALEATLETSATQPQAGRRSFVNELWPIGDMPSATGQVIVHSMKPADADDEGALSNMNAAGFCPAHKSGRYFKGRIIIPANAEWERVTGVQFAYKDAGKR